MAKASKRPMAVFQAKKYVKIGNFILKAKAIVLDIGNNAPYFATPSPTLSSVTTDIGKLETGESTAHTHVDGSSSARDLLYNAVLNDIHGLLNYVQGIADKAANEAASIAIIEASGFAVKGKSSLTKNTLSAKFDTKTGIVKLIAKAAGKRASYNWQYSTDGGTTWVDAPSTLQAKTTISGLILSNKLAFRVQAVTKNGASTWSDGVTL